MKMTRRQYAEMFGPTVGDQVRLADTELFVEVERDYIAEAGAHGDEVKFGGGKVIRDGMGQSPTARDAESLDLVITNALILDAVQGVAGEDSTGHTSIGRLVRSKIWITAPGMVCDRPSPA